MFMLQAEHCIGIGPTMYILHNVTRYRLRGDTFWITLWLLIYGINEGVFPFKFFNLALNSERRHAPACVKSPLDFFEFHGHEFLI